MKKLKTSILILMIFTLFTGCSNSDTDTSYPEFPSRWTSNNGSKYHVVVSGLERLYKDVFKNQ